MTTLEAAFSVLQEAGEPLHYREITRRILEADLWKTAGQTPEATVNARLGTDVKTKGEASAFRRTGPGIFALNVGIRLPEAAAPSRSLPKRSPAARRNAPCPATALSFTEAAHKILESGRGKPLHYRDITRQALDRGMLQTLGRTPEATMYAQILTECKRRQGRGEQPRFMLLGKGMISLAKWQARGLSFQVEEANRRARKDLLKAVKEMLPSDFEDLIGRLLAAIGFEEVEVTSKTKDGGIDVRGILVVGDVIRTRLAVQVKRWKANIQSPVIQQVRGSLGAHEQGLVITTSDFSRGACQEAERADTTPVGLMNGEQLVALLVEHEIGARRTPLHLIQVGERSPGAPGESPPD